MLYLFHAAIPTLFAMYYEIFMQKAKKNPLVYVCLFCFLLLVNIFFGTYIYPAETHLKNFKFNIPNGHLEIVYQGVYEYDEIENKDTEYIYYVSMNGTLCPYSCKTEWQATVMALSIQWALYELGED
jgi:hypothetical protein